MCFNLNILNICLAKKSSSSSKSRGKKTSSSSASSANNNNNNNNNNNTTSLANNSANTTLKVANDEPVEQPSDTTTNNNTSPNHYNSPYPQPPPPPQRLKHPNTLALRTSNNFNQAVSELECENEETLNSLYLANNISYLVDRDRIIDTPGNQAATLEEELVCDSDFYRRLPSSSRFQHHASPDLEDDWDLEQKEDHELNKSKQPLLKYLNNSNTNTSNKSNRFDTVYKSISSSQNTASTKSTPLAGSFFGQTGGLAAVQSSLARINTSNEQQQQQQQQQTNQVNNSQLNDQYLPSSSSSSSSSTSKSSSFSSLVNTSSNQSPYSSVSTLIQNQQQQQLKFNPVKLFHQTMSNNNNNSPTHSGGGPSAQRPILGIPSRPGFSSPGLIPTPSSTASQLEALKIENLRPKKQAYYFQADNQLLIGRPNELPMLSSHDDDELSSILDEELNNSKSDENSKDSATSGAGKHHHHLSHQQQQQQQQRNQQQLHHASSSGGHHQHHGHHHHHHHISLNNIKSRGGKITISPQQVYEFKESDFNDLGQIGNGEFGSVHKVLHKPSQTMMAMKRVGPTVGNQGERKKVLKELDFVLECHDYAYVVKFYGVKFNNEPADCLICMELMDTSLEKFYKFVYDVKHEEIPEAILGKVVVAAVNALNYLKEEYQIIHRDVKPSNMLINRRGEIKMCDFGISGKLVDSIAASRDAGCQLYMAPERIDPTKACANGYDVRSDVWSLGITMYELATGKFPYPQWKTIFHQLNLVVDSDAPRIESARLSQDFKDFVNTCLTKDEKKRPKYRQLLQYPLLKFHSTSDVNVAAYVEPYINEMLAMSSSSNNAK